MSVPIIRIYLKMVIFQIQNERYSKLNYQHMFEYKSVTVFDQNERKLISYFITGKYCSLLTKRWTVVCFHHNIKIITDLKAQWNYNHKWRTRFSSSCAFTSKYSLIRSQCNTFDRLLDRAIVWWSAARVLSMLIFHRHFIAAVYFIRCIVATQKERGRGRGRLKEREREKERYREREIERERVREKEWEMRVKEKLKLCESQSLCGVWKCVFLRSVKMRIRHAFILLTMCLQIVLNILHLPVVNHLMVFGCTSKRLLHWRVLFHSIIDVLKTCVREWAFLWTMWIS